MTNRVQIKRVGKFWTVMVQDTPGFWIHPSVPRYHTAGVYYTEQEAIALYNELSPAQGELFA